MTLRDGSKRRAAWSRPMLPSLIRSSSEGPAPEKRFATFTTKRRLASTSLWIAFWSPFCASLPRRISSSRVSSGILEISRRYAPSEASGLVNRHRAPPAARSCGAAHRGARPDAHERGARALPLDLALHLAAHELERLLELGLHPLDLAPHLEHHLDAGEVDAEVARQVQDPAHRLQVAPPSTAASRRGCAAAARTPRARRAAGSGGARRAARRPR